VIHAGLNAGVSWQHGQADDAIADVTPVGFCLPVSSTVPVVMRFIPKTVW